MQDIHFIAIISFCLFVRRQPRENTCRSLNWVRLVKRLPFVRTGHWTGQPVLTNGKQTTLKPGPNKDESWPPWEFSSTLIDYHQVRLNKNESRQDLSERKKDQTIIDSHEKFEHV